MFALALTMLLAAAPVFSESEARQGADWVRISALACKSEQVLAKLAARGENPLDYRAARAEFQGAPYVACWKPMFERRVILLVYEDGDEGLVPFAELKPVREV